MIEIQFTRLPHGEGLPVPNRATEGAAGYDVVSADDGALAPLERKLFRTGFRLAIPAGFECQVRPRSGLALKHGISLPNTPATIDSDYRGELMIALVNLSQEPFEVTRGMRIAQLIFARVEAAGFREVSELPASARGAGGFGSTGTGRLGG
jgi:dUTP pyrophosphatase